MASDATFLSESSSLTPTVFAYTIVCFILVLLFSAWILSLYARPAMPLLAKALVYPAFVLTFAICFMVPIDLLPRTGDALQPIWTASFWMSFVLMWIVLPFVSGVYDNGEFTWSGKMRASLKFNGMLLITALVIGGAGFIYLAAAQHMSIHTIADMIMCASNVWGLLILIGLLGYGLVEVPRMLFHNSNIERQRDYILYLAVGTWNELEETRDMLAYTSRIVRGIEARIAAVENPELDRKFQLVMLEMTEKEVQLEQNYNSSEVIDKPVVLEELRDEQNITDHHLVKLNYHVKSTVRHLNLIETQWRDIVDECIELDAALDHSHSGLNQAPEGFTFMQKLRWWLKIGARKKLCLFGGFTGAVLSGLLLWSEITLLASTNLSLLGWFIELTRGFPLTEQIFTAVPMIYMSICAYYPLFHLRLGKLYYIGLHRTDEMTLLLCATLLLRVATPLAYNFVLLLKIDVTSLAAFIGNIEAIPFFGGDFMHIFPLFIGVISLLVFFNVFTKLRSFLNLNQFKYSGHAQKVEEDDGSISEGRRLISDEKRRRGINASIEPLKKDRMAAFIGGVKSGFNQP